MTPVVILANVTVFTVFAGGVVRVASQRTYDPWWPSSAFFYLAAAAITTLLLAASLTVCHGGLKDVMILVLLTGAEVASLCLVLYAIGDDTFVACPPPPDGDQLVRIQTALDLTSGRVVCHFSDSTGTNDVTTTFPVLRTLTGRL